jgi:hypothetical protein
MEEEFISNKEYDEIEISKYGKRKINTNNNNKHLYKYIYTIFILFVFSILLILYIYLHSEININDKLSEEFQSKDKNNLEENNISDKDKLNEIALRTKLKMYPLAQYFLKRTDHALLNIFKLVKINKEDIDINRFILALNKTIYNHPVLLSRFHKEDDGEIYIDYRPDLPPEIKIINIRDEEIRNLKDKLLHIYNPFNSSLVNFTLFISNTSVYFYYDIFHSNFDGNSVAIFENNLELAYLNKPLPKDYFFLNLYHYNEKLKTKKYEDTIKFYKENFDLNREYCPKFDDDIPENIRNNGTLQLIYKEYSSKELRKQLREYFGDKPKYYNIFMTMNILLTDYIYSDFKDEYPTAKIGFNGRNWTEDSNSVGCLIYNYPVIYHFQNKVVNIKEFYKKILELYKKKKDLMKYPFEHTEKYTSLMSIIQTKAFYKNVFDGKKLEIIYGYNNLLNSRSKYLMTPIMMELFIDDDTAKYSSFFDDKFYKQSSADKYFDILIKTSKLIMENFNNENDINLENKF